MLPMLLTVAEFPAEMLVWIVVGIIWAAIQLFAKAAKKRAAADEAAGDTARPPRTPTRPVGGSTDPVSPNDELRRFLRELAGEPAETPPPAMPPPRADPAAAKPPAPRRRQPVPALAPIAEPSAQAIAIARRRAAATAAFARSVAEQRDIAAPNRAAARWAVGNLRQAVLHREILGPPRAVRPYSTEFQ